MSKKSSIQAAKNKITKKNLLPKEEVDSLEQVINLFESGKSFSPACEGEQVYFLQEHIKEPFMVCKTYDSDYNAKKSYISVEEAKELIKFFQKFVDSAQ